MVTHLPWAPSLGDCTVAIWRVTIVSIMSAQVCGLLLFSFSGLWNFISYTNWLKRRLINFRIIHLWLERDRGIVIFLLVLSENFNHRPLKLKRTEDNSCDSFTLRFWSWGAKITCGLSRLTRLAHGAGGARVLLPRLVDSNVSHLAELPLTIVY